MNKPLATLILIAVTLPLAAAQTAAIPPPQSRTLDDIANDIDRVLTDKLKFQISSDAGCQLVDPNTTSTNPATVKDCTNAVPAENLAGTVDSPAAPVLQPVPRSRSKFTLPDTRFTDGEKTVFLSLNHQAASAAAPMDQTVAYSAAVNTVIKYEADFNFPTIDSRPAYPDQNKLNNPRRVVGQPKTEIAVFDPTLVKPEDLYIKERFGLWCTGKEKQYICNPGKTKPASYLLTVDMQHGETRVLGVFTNEKTAKRALGLYIEAINLYAPKNQPLTWCSALASTAPASGR